jgi:RNA polymerase-binding transcription factor DksA
MDRKRLNARLNAERLRLEGLLGAVRGELTSEDPGGEPSIREIISELSMHDLHPADVGTEMFEHEKSHSILTSIEAELHEVGRALDRVKDGSYGRCEACSRPIRAARLQALPATRYCLDDQARVERQAKAS